MLTTYLIITGITYLTLFTGSILNLGELTTKERTKETKDRASQNLAFCGTSLVMIIFTAFLLFH